jgi:hypothetical protein
MHRLVDVGLLAIAVQGKTTKRQSARPNARCFAEWRRNKVKRFCLWEAANNVTGETLEQRRACLGRECFTLPNVCK